MALSTSMLDCATIRNDTIQHNIELANQTIIHAMEKMAEDGAEKARLLAEIALLRAEFASRAFELERTELLLGEADYLDLNPQWRKQAESALSNIELAIDNIQNAARAKK